ncbi:MAG: hypothetical protein QOD75_3152 [Blastocatellia bacterium]|nr:hypothetical protein [Blastocatellia bacterium]
MQIRFLLSIGLLLLLPSVVVFAQKPELADTPELVVQTEHTSYVWSVVFSPESRLLASASDAGVDDGTIKLWEVATGRELRTLAGHGLSILQIAFGPEGKTIAGTDGRFIRLWDTASGNEILTIQGGDRFWSVAFSPDGKTLASGNTDGTIQLWEVASGRELRTLNAHSGGVTSVAFSPDGKTLASGGRDNAVRLWDVARRLELRSFTGHTSWVWSVSFRKDGKTLASGSADGTARLWNLESGSSRIMFSTKGAIVAIGLRPDGKTLASSDGKAVRLISVDTGQEQQRLPDLTKNVKTVAFSPDNSLLAYGGVDSTIKLWNLNTNQELFTFKNHASLARGNEHISTAMNGGLKVELGKNGIINLIRLRGGVLACSLIALDENDWLVVTPDGLFDGSPAAWNKIIWRFNNNTFDYAPVEAFFSEFYHPGLLGEITSGQRPTASSKIAQLDRRQPSVKFVSSQKGSSAVQNATLRIEVEESRGLIAQPNPQAESTGRKRRQPSRSRLMPLGSGAEDLRLFRNGSLVKLWQGNAFKLGPQDHCQQLLAPRPNAPRRVSCEATVPIIAGKNEFTAYAFNHDNIKSVDAAPVEIMGTEKHDAITYIVAIGINAYADSDCKLNYARADAETFATEFAHQQRRLGLPPENIKVVPLYDERATRANILNELAQLAIKVKPEDTVVIFFAGHGVAQGDRFYLVPSDLGISRGRCNELTAASLKIVKAHSITDKDLELALRPLDAGRLLLILDSCQSGQILAAKDPRQGPMNSKGLAQLAYEKGMYILTAAQSYEEAQENRELHHGFLTDVLIREGLKSPEVDVSHDKAIDVREWLDYATRRVPQLQEQLRAQEQGSKRGQMSSATHRLQPENEIQHPRVFYRREFEPQPWIIARQ